MKIVSYIKQKYEAKKVRKYLKYYHSGIPEIYWESTSDKINEKANTIVGLIEKNGINVLGIITEDKRFTDKLVAEILKIFSAKNDSKLFWFDFFLSEFFNKWNGVFDYDKLLVINEKSVIGVMGVSCEGQDELKIGILTSFSKFINSITKTGTITRVIIGLDTMKKDDVKEFYGVELYSVLGEIITIKVGEDV